MRRYRVSSGGFYFGLVTAACAADACARAQGRFNLHRSMFVAEAV